MAKITKKNEVFCEEYLIDLNATQAAILSLIHISEPTRPY